MAKKQKASSFPVVVETEAAEMAAAEQIGKLAREIVASHIETGTLYYNLCATIRASKVPPKVVRRVMGQHGFTKVRISEVLRVAHVPQAMWSAFEAKTIGFRKALVLARCEGKSEIDTEKRCVMLGPVEGEEAGGGEPPRLPSLALTNARMRHELFISV